MRPTLEYVKEKFEYYNQLCFGGILTMPPIRLCLRKYFLGLTSLRDGHIEISVHDDLPEEELIAKVDRRKRNVLVIEYNSGNVAFAVVAKNKLTAIICYILEQDDINTWKHCISDRAIFGAFPVQIIPHFTDIDSDTINRYLTGAQIIESSEE